MSPLAAGGAGDFLDHALDRRLGAGGPDALEVGQGALGGVVELPLAVVEAAVLEARHLAAAVDQAAVAELAVGEALAVELDGLVVEDGPRLHRLAVSDHRWGRARRSGTGPGRPRAARAWRRPSRRPSWPSGDRARRARSCSWAFAPCRVSP